MYERRRPRRWLKVKVSEWPDAEDRWRWVKARFCEECAAPSARPCANCGAHFPRLPSSAPSPRSRWYDGPAGPRALRGTESHTPKHLAERILTSKAAFEGVRKQVTVSFADLKGSMELAQSYATGRLTTNARPPAAPRRGIPRRDTEAESDQLSN